MYAFEAYDKVPLVKDELFDTESSEGAYEQYTTVVGPGPLQRVGEAVTIPNQTMIEGYTAYCANFKVATELPMSNEAIDDNRKIKNILKQWATELGEDYAVDTEDEHADLFNFGGFTAGHSTFLNDIPAVLTTSYGQFVYDGKPFFNTSDNLRPNKTGGSYYNGILNLPVSETNLQKLYQLLTSTNAFNEAGMRINMRPNVVIAKTGSDVAWALRRILESSGSPEATHEGVVNLWKGKLRLIEWSALTNPNAYFMGVMKKGLKSLTRLPLSIDYYENKQMDGQVVRSRKRYGRAVTNWRYWVGANFSQS